MLNSKCKLLSIEECHFNLPDDFDGSLGDALMLLAQYRLQCEADKKVNKVNDYRSCYIQLIETNGINCSIKYALCKISDDGTRWEAL